MADFNGQELATATDVGAEQGTSGGVSGGDLVAPTVDNFSPANGSVIVDTDPFFFDVKDNLASFSGIFVYVDPGNGMPEAVYDLAANVFIGTYSNLSSTISISSGLNFRVRRFEGWLGTVTATIRVVDSSGNKKHMTTASWLLQTTSTTTATASSITGETSFARRGLILPFRRDQKQDFANGESALVLQSNVRQILGTRCSDGFRVPGEIPWMQSFGSLLYKLRHQNIKPVVKYQARAYVIDALTRWEPRIRVRDVDIEDSKRSILVRTSFFIIAGYGVGRADDQPIAVTNEILKAA